MIKIIIYLSILSFFTFALANVSKFEILKLLDDPSMLGYIHAVTLITILLTDIPLSRLVDRTSRKIALILGTLCFGIFACVMFFATVKLLFIIAVILGVGNSLFSGTSAAMIVETCKNKAERFLKLSQVDLYAMIMALLGNVLAIYFYIYFDNLVWIVLAASLTSLSLLGFYLLPKNKTNEQTEKPLTLKLIYPIFFETKRNLLMFSSGICFSILLTVINTYWIAYFFTNDQRQIITVDNSIFIIFATSGVIVSKLIANLLLTNFKFNFVLKFISFTTLAIAAFIVFASTSNFVFIVSFAMSIIILTTVTRLTYTYFQGLVENTERSTISSIQSTINTALNIPAVILVGILINKDINIVLYSTFILTFIISLLFLTHMYKSKLIT